MAYSTATAAAGILGYWTSWASARLAPGAIAYESLVDTLGTLSRVMIVAPPV